MSWPLRLRRRGLRRRREPGQRDGASRVIAAAIDLSDQTVLEFAMLRESALPAATEIECAGAFLGQHLTPTRLVPAPSLTALAGRPVLLKLESDLPTGSFKVRGALVTDMRLVTEQQMRSAIERLATDEHVVAEPAAAATAACLASSLDGSVCRPPGSSDAAVVLVITGGNIAPGLLRRSSEFDVPPIIDLRGL